MRHWAACVGTWFLVVVVTVLLALPFVSSHPLELKTVEVTGDFEENGDVVKVPGLQSAGHDGVVPSAPSAGENGETIPMIVPQKVMEMWQRAVYAGMPRKQAKLYPKKWRASQKTSTLRQEEEKNIKKKLTGKNKKQEQMIVFPEPTREMTLPVHEFQPQLNRELAPPVHEFELNRKMTPPVHEFDAPLPAELTPPVHEFQPQMNSELTPPVHEFQPQMNSKLTPPVHEFQPQMNSELTPPVHEFQPQMNSELTPPVHEFEAPLPVELTPPVHESQPLVSSRLVYPVHEYELLLPRELTPPVHEFKGIEPRK